MQLQFPDLLPHGTIANACNNSSRASRQHKTATCDYKSNRVAYHPGSIISQLNVPASSALLELTTKLTPGVITPTLRIPRLAPLLVSHSQIRLAAVTAVVAIVTVPATRVPVPILALAPPLIRNPAPAVLVKKLPLTDAVWKTPPTCSELLPVRVRGASGATAPAPSAICPLARNSRRLVTSPVTPMPITGVTPTPRISNGTET